MAGLVLALLLGGCDSWEPGGSGTLSDILGGGGSPSSELVCYHREAQCPVAANAQPGDLCFCSVAWGYLRGRVRPQ